MIVHFMLSLLIIGSFALTVGADEEPHRWVADSKLPYGLGIAADYVADHNIQSHQSVIFAD